MTKNDYVKLAGVIKAGVGYAKSGAGNFDRRYKLEAVKAVADELAKVLAADNPKFSPVTFYRACGLSVPGACIGVPWGSVIYNQAA